MGCHGSVEHYLVRLRIIEVRWCSEEPFSSEEIATELLEIFVM